MPKINVQDQFQRQQGRLARLLDRIPGRVQQRMVRTLQTNPHLSGMHPFLQIMLATRQRRQVPTLIGRDYVQSRRHLIAESHSVGGRPTTLAAVNDVLIDLPDQDLAARHYHPQPRKQLPMVVFFHGGGFVVGNVTSHDEFCRLLAKHANVQVISVNYPLAPEHSARMITRTCCDVVRWVHQHQRRFAIQRGRIAVAGDSAGGNLSTVVSQQLQGTPAAPSAQLLIYPAVDFKKRYPSFDLFKSGTLLSHEDITNVLAFYAEPHEGGLDDPIISPLYGDVSQLAPAYVVTAEYDVLRDEGAEYVKKLQAAGRVVQHQHIDDMIHAFINLTAIHRAAKDHVIDIAQRFRTFWDQQPTR